MWAQWCGAGFVCEDFVKDAHSIYAACVLPVHMHAAQFWLALVSVPSVASPGDMQCTMLLLVPPASHVVMLLLLRYTC